VRVSVTFRAGLGEEATLRAHAQDRLERLRVLFPRPMQAHLVLNKERFAHVAELSLMVDGSPLIAIAKHEDAQAAVDAALSKVAARLRRLKGKVTDHRPPEHRRAARVRRAQRPPANALAIEPVGPVFAARESYALASFTPEAAIAEMERRGAGVLLYRNARTKRANVVYRTPDGQYALVEATTRTK
jgi:putative sigma-54 modulation protein